MLVTLYKREGTKPAHYYSLDDRQQNLFNPFTITVSWGLQPEGGVRRHYVFESLAEKNLFVRKTITKKLKTYKVLYSYFKEQQEDMRVETDRTTGGGSTAGSVLFRRA